MYMTRRKRKKKRQFSFDHGLEQETIYGILAVLFLVLGIIFILAPMSLAGPVGAKTYELLTKLLGLGYFLLPLLSFVLAISFFRVIHTSFFGTTKTISAVIFFLSGLGLVDIITDDKGGLLGHWISSPIIRFFDVYAGSVILFALALISIIVLFNAIPSLESLTFWRRWKKDKDLLDDEDVDISDEEEYYDDDEHDEVEEEEPEREKTAVLPVPPQRKAIYQSYVPPPLKLLEKDKGRPGAGARCRRTGR